MPLTSRVPSADGPRLVLYRPADPGRPRLEAFIASVYARSYRARIRQFAPILAAWEDDAGILAAAGFRSAVDPLFLERYLDQPIEVAVAPSRPPHRSQIVEVGNFASARAGEGRRLLLALAIHLASQDVQWVAATVTAELRQVVVRLGLGLVALAPAHRDRLGRDASHWGSYFDHDPIVVAGHLPPALHTLRQRAGRGDARR
jgi:hypothetical protein